jgi:hypothetical protein
MSTTMAERIQAKLAYLDLQAQRHRDGLSWAERSGDAIRAERLRGWLAGLEARREELLARLAALPAPADPVAAPSLPSVRGWASRSPVDIAGILERSLSTLARRAVRGDQRAHLLTIATAAAVVLVDQHDEAEARGLDRQPRDGEEETP